MFGWGGGEAFSSLLRTLEVGAEDEKPQALEALCMQISMAESEDEFRGLSLSHFAQLMTGLLADNDFFPDVPVLAARAVTNLVEVRASDRAFPVFFSRCLFSHVDVDAHPSFPAPVT